MLISPEILRKKFLVSPSGVLHVGAHRAEEKNAYREQDFGRIIWVEAQPNLISTLQRDVRGSGDIVLEGAVWGTSGVKKTFHITNNGQSSSLYELAKHSLHYPRVIRVGKLEVETIRLDDLLPSDELFDFVNLDVQGAELEALSGLGKRIEQVQWVYTEVNRAELYSGIPLVAELDEFLNKAGFSRVCTVWTDGDWGDALYCRRSSYLKFLLVKVRGMEFSLRPVFRSWLKIARERLADPIYRRFRDSPAMTNHKR